MDQGDLEFDAEGEAGGTEGADEDEEEEEAMLVGAGEAGLQRAFFAPRAN